jgi:ABC-type transport system involved in cytochrome c biogenesis permease component
MFKKIALIPVLLLPLTGCVPVVLVAAGATTGTVIAKDPRGFGVAKRDRQTTLKTQPY